MDAHHKSQNGEDSEIAKWHERKVRGGEYFPENLIINEMSCATNSLAKSGASFPVFGLLV